MSGPDRRRPPFTAAPGDATCKRRHPARTPPMPAQTATQPSAPNATKTAAQPLVAVLLCTYDGEEYLAGQLNSIALQTHRRWKVWVSDDGSRDRTGAILQQYEKQWGSGLFSVLKGPGSGYVANFMSLLCNSRIVADTYAYADQDDHWETDKLARAVAWLETIPGDTPALYMSRTRLIDRDDNDLGLAPLFTAKPPSFANAIVQNIGGGNTMVMNNAARTLVMANSKDVAIVSHDWWTYLMVSGAGGRVFYDPYPGVRYRQHGGNLIGSNDRLPARLWRARQVLGGRFKRWGEINAQGLARVREQLTRENRRIFDDFSTARTGFLPLRLLALKRSGVHRQGFIDNIGLYVAALFNRL